MGRSMLRRYDEGSSQIYFGELFRIDLIFGLR
jgi:hypothetical protein